MDTPHTGADRKRRGVLRSLAAGTTLAIAGCLGGDDDTEERDDSDSDDTDTENGSGNGGENGDGPEEVAPAQLEQRAQEFVELLDAGDFDTAHDLASEEFSSQLPPDEMEQFWDQQIAVFGDIAEFTAVEYRGEREDGAATVVVRAQLSDRPVEFQFAFGDGEIIEFLALPSAEWVPPEYVDQDAFTETEITVDAPGDCELGATLSMPESEGDVPGVVIVQGSGDQGRDGVAGPNRTYRELAQGLASKGVAVLRYDQRTVACDVDRTVATLDDIKTDDAVTAVERLGEEEYVSRVYVAGHSLGGRVAPRIAERADTAGIVMLAPLAEPVHEAIVRQTRHVLTLDGELSERDEEALAETEALAEQLRTLDIGADETLDIGGGERGRPYWESLQEYDHTGTVADLDLPILLVQGGRDYLVTVEDDLPLWEQAIGGEPTVDIEVFEELNHRFQPGEQPASPEEWTEAENPVDESVVELIAEFL